MPNYGRTENGRSNVLAWSTHTTNMAPTVEEDAGADVDEPPDSTTVTTTRPPLPEVCHSFKKTVVQRPRERVESLLTRALQSQSEDEAVDSNAAGRIYVAERRRSMTSNTSLASTAGFTSDTGITTPPRTNSPSPRLTDLGLAPVHAYQLEAKKTISFATPKGRPEADCTPKPSAKDAPAAAAVPAPPATQPRKRCISFACAAAKPAQSTSDATKKPAPAPAATTAAPKETPVVVAPQPRRPCIKFACPAKPTTDSHKPQLGNLKADGQEGRKLLRRPSPAPEPRSPTTVRKYRGSSSGRSPRSITPRSSNRTPAPGRSPHSPLAIRSKKYLTAETQDLDGESSRFHEFASDKPLEEDWIRHSKTETRERRLTINDTLQKENAIRLLGKEAEEEAEQEEQEEEDDDEEDDEDGEGDEEDDEDEDEDDEDEEDDEDDDIDETETVEGNGGHYLADRYGEFSDGYSTDNEIGFASSDEDEDDGLVLWSVNQETQDRRREAYRSIDHSTFQLENSPKLRRLSGAGSQSDSSSCLVGQRIRQSQPKITRPFTPELPDSTDFVCGTFDEDRPLEEAYLSHIAARKQNKLHAIPQDIDPSFPTSDVEDESDDERHRQKHRQQSRQGSVDDNLWQLDDLHHDKQDRVNNHRRKKGESPRRYHSPPPPKNRGRSPAPRRLFDRHSPGRRIKSPAPKAMPMRQAHGHAPVKSLPASPVEVPGGAHFQTLAFRPGLTTTKSLPRPAAIFRHQNGQVHAQGPASKPHRRPKANNSTTKPMHIRGALDIVKGLEQKRQRRNEKFQQKYCNRARKGQVVERKPQRGEGAERMREIGLLMAGKAGQGNYVMSF